MSNAWSLAALSRICLLVASAGLFLLSVRFCWFVFEDVSGFYAEQSRQAAGASPRKRQRAPEEEAQPEPQPSSELGFSAAKSAVSTAPLVPELRTLLVQFGPARSEVFINGVRLGETPFAGQWTCVDGDPLNIQVVPRRGVPLERHLRCGGTTLLAGPAPAP